MLVQIFCSVASSQMFSVRTETGRPQTTNTSAVRNVFAANKRHGSRSVPVPAPATGRKELLTLRIAISIMTGKPRTPHYVYTHRAVVSGGYDFVNVKLFLCIKHNAMNLYGGVEVWLHAFLTPATDR
jgi:hypothetical protein